MMYVESYTANNLSPTYRNSRKDEKSLTSVSLTNVPESFLVLCDSSKHGGNWGQSDMVVSVEPR